MRWLIGPGCRTTFLKTEGGNYCSMHRVANHGSGQGRVNEAWKLGAVVTGCCLSGAQSRGSIDWSGTVFRGAWSLHPPR